MVQIFFLFRVDLILRSREKKSLIKTLFVLLNPLEKSFFKISRSVEFLLILRGCLIHFRNVVKTRTKNSFQRQIKSAANTCTGVQKKQLLLEKDYKIITLNSPS